MRRFPKIMIDVSLSPITCRKCRKTIPPHSAVYMISETVNASSVLPHCEGCCDREIDRRIAVIKDEYTTKEAAAKT